MIGSLYSGISGLKANTSAMAVIGDNIANVDTTGFKTSRVSFANIFSSSLNPSSLQIGRGVMLNGVNQQWDSGSIESTTSGTDLAISGTGMFVVQDPNTGTDYFSRAGQFEWDADGNLVTPDGFIVRGYEVDSTGATLSGLTNIVMPNGTNSPSATDEITFGLNLDSTSSDPFTTSITTYDSLGAEVILDITFTPAGSGVWNWAVAVDSATNPAAACATTGTITFDATGNLNAATIAAGNPTLAITGLTPASDMSITWTYLDSTPASDGSVTGYASDSVKTAQTQNGYPSGTLQSVYVDEDGFFTGIYSNGKMLPFAQIALADFPSYGGLSKIGSNLYAESLASGQALYGTPNSAGMGSITASSLEMSNVDMATEFVEMITTQRAYQANSKVITTSDEILQDLIAIKR